MTEYTDQELEAKWTQAKLEGHINSIVEYVALHGAQIGKLRLYLPDQDVNMYEYNDALQRMLIQNHILPGEVCAPLFVLKFLIDRGLIKSSRQAVAQVPPPGQGNFNAREILHYTVAIRKFTRKSTGLGNEQLKMCPGNLKSFIEANQALISSYLEDGFDVVSEKQMILKAYHACLSTGVVVKEASLSKNTWRTVAVIFMIFSSLLGVALLWSSVQLQNGLGPCDLESVGYVQKVRKVEDTCFNSLKDCEEKLPGLHFHKTQLEHTLMDCTQELSDCFVNREDCQGNLDSVNTQLRLLEDTITDCNKELKQVHLIREQYVTSFHECSEALEICKASSATDQLTIDALGSQIVQLKFDVGVLIDSEESLKTAVQACINDSMLIESADNVCKCTKTDCIHREYSFCVEELQTMNFTHVMLLKRNEALHDGVEDLSKALKLCRSNSQEQQQNIYEKLICLMNCLSTLYSIYKLTTTKSEETENLKIELDLARINLDRFKLETEQARAERDANRIRELEETIALKEEEKAKPKPKWKTRVLQFVNVMDIGSRCYLIFSAFF